MRRANISIFVPHKGCPNDCSFCNQRAISGQTVPATEKDVADAVKTAINHNIEPKSTEIAFFGGSFTAIERGYMLSLLTAAKHFSDIYGFAGIRISTRPDCIDREILDILKNYGVTAIELGAQSMDDSVLLHNHRGHTAGQVCESSALIREYGFSLGLQMMTGLYKSSFEKDRLTAMRIIDLHPDTVRIYPTVVLKNTYLGELYLKGEYTPPNAEESVSLCAELLQMFENEGIRVIKLGLHSSETLEADMLGGAYHPAFRELCEGHIYLQKMREALKNRNKECEYDIFVPEKALSKAKGQNKRNEKALKNDGFYCKIKGKNSLQDFEVEVAQTV
ncbi:MAG: radical SAM protein [Oscillospiraceae bacterium]|nr:radical SAM protein [Oscillospiraceae bacterium]